MDQTILSLLQSLVAETGNQPNWNAREICSLTLSANSSNHFSFVFRSNSGQEYVLLIFTQDIWSWSTVECDAFLDAFHIAMVGTDMNNDIFEQLVNSLNNKYSRVSTPQFIVNHRIAAILPGSFFERPSLMTPHRITSTTMHLNKENRIILRHQTSSGYIYLLSLIASFPDYGLSFSDCRFLSYALNTFRTGISLPPDAFLAEALFFQETCGSVLLDIMGENSNVYQLTFKSLSDGSKLPAPQQVLEAASRVFSPCCTWFPLSDTPKCLKPSPYPLIMYIREIDAEGDEELYLTLRRQSPCSLKVFSSTFNSDEFFRVTIKQLLIMPHHPNIIGVVDWYEEPKPAILLESLDGDSLGFFMARRLPLDEQLRWKLILGIAEGLNFLHRYGLVHYRLTLRNIIVREGSCPLITGIEYGRIDEKESFVQTGHTKNRVEEPLTKVVPTETIGASSATDAKYGIIPGVSLQVHNPDGLQSTFSGERTSTNSYEDRIDVAAFGLIVWQICSENEMYFEKNEKINEQILSERIFNRSDELLSKLGHVPDSIINVVRSAWQEDPKQRPEISEILKKLREYSSTLAQEPNEETESHSQRNNSFSRTSSIEKEESVDESTNDRPCTESATVEQSATKYVKSSHPRIPIILKDKYGNDFDAFTNYKTRYSNSVGARNISMKTRAFLNWVDCNRQMNTIQNISVKAAWKAISQFDHLPGINQTRREEAFVVFGEEIMTELEKGFSASVQCRSVEAIFNALTSPYRGKVLNAHETVDEKTHFRAVLSYRHVHPDERLKQGWPHRQRMQETDYRELASRISFYACSIGAQTVAIWTDQHFAGTQSSDSWANNCLLPYAVYPVVYYETGIHNHERLWICAEHHLAVSGEGIISEVNELEGVWRKTQKGAVAGKLLPLSRGLVEAATCLLPTIYEKETYHQSDRDDIISWTRALAFLGYSRDIWKIYQEMPSVETTSEVAMSIIKQSWSPTWIWQQKRPRWRCGAVLRTSNRSTRIRSQEERGWHSLWEWVQDLKKDYEDSSEMFATVEVESFTRVTQITSDDRIYGFVFLIGAAGQIGRCGIVVLEDTGEAVRVQNVTILCDFQFTVLADNLLRIACLKDAQVSDVQDEWKFVMETHGCGNFPRERIGLPNLEAVNEVLNLLDMSPITEMLRVDFLDGYEIVWT